MKMSRLQPQMQDIQRRYADDPQRQNAAVQALYKEEGVSMGGGCLWSLVPMLIILPLYTVVRQPLVYMLHEPLEVAQQIVDVLKIRFLPVRSAPTPTTTRLLPPSSFPSMPTC